MIFDHTDELQQVILHMELETSQNYHFCIQNLAVN